MGDKPTDAEHDLAEKKATFRFSLSVQSPYTMKWGEKKPMHSTLTPNGAPDIISRATPQALLSKMADDLSAVQDPWARQWLILPGAGRAEWVQQRWSDARGIASRSQHLSVRAVVELVAAQAAHLFSDEAEAYSLEALTLAIADLLPEIPNTPLPDRDKLPYIDGPALSWAQHIADAIDMGLLCRFDQTDTSAQRFADDSFLQWICKQANIAPLLAAHIGSLDDEIFSAATKEWLRSWEKKGGCPHLWIQLDTGLPTVLMQRLNHMLSLLPADHVHLYLLEPSSLFWGDLSTGRKTLYWNDEDNAGPLLSPFGRRLQDLHNQAIDLWDSGGDGFYTDAPPADTLLGRLQRCSLQDPDIPWDTDTCGILPANDHSFSVHSCRSPLRELEICRDRILQAMHEDSHLRAEEIVVLLASPSDYAPLVTAAFQPQAQHDLHIPFRTLSLNGASNSSIAEAIQLILQALAGRFTQEQFLSLIEHPLIAERFGFDNAGTSGDDNLLNWVQNACFRWGLNRTHRQHYQAHNDERWSLAFALQRLVLGAICDYNRQTTDTIEGHVPLSRASGLKVQSLAALAALLEQLIHMREQWADTQPASLATWSERTAHILEQLLGDGGRNEQQQRATLINSILPQLERCAPENIQVNASAFKRLLIPQLDDVTANMSNGVGGVTVASLSSYAGTPAKMIVVCGLGNDRFPRVDDRPDWHPLASSRAWGDPSMRDDDRHNILLCVLAAAQRFVCTYEGGSDNDDKIRPPSTPLADLIDAALQCCKSVDNDKKIFCFEHGLNGFSPQAHQAQASVQTRSFLASDSTHAQTLIAAPPPAQGLWRQALPLPKNIHIHRRTLKDLINQPCKLFAAELGLHFSEEKISPEQGDRLTIDNLEAWGIRSRLLRSRLLHTDSHNDEHIFRQVQASGELPPGLLGETVWNTVQEKTPNWDGSTLTALQHQEDLPLLSYRINTQTESLWARDETGALHFFTVSSFALPKTKKSAPTEYGSPFIQMCIDLLLFAVQEQIQPSATLHYGTSEEHISLTTTQTPEELLHTLIQLIPLAQAAPIPMDKQLFTTLSKESDSEKALHNAMHHWSEGNSFAGGTSPAKDEAIHRLCFRQLENPFTWLGPDDPSYQSACNAMLPDPSFPLAWRFAQALHQWVSEVNA